MNMEADQTPSASPEKPRRTRDPAQTADAASYRVEMLPLAMRVAVSQHTRLSSVRDRTGISIQEHVRRAIDLYLAVVEREAIELGHVPAVPSAPADHAESNRPLTKPKVVRR